MGHDVDWVIQRQPQQDATKGQGHNMNRAKYKVDDRDSGDHSQGEGNKDMHHYSQRSQ